MSGATTWKPASASALIWWRQEYQLSGKPWHSKTRGPWPCSTTFRLMPLVLTIRSIGLLMVLAPPKSWRFAPIRRDHTGEQGATRRVAEYLRQRVLATVASLRPGRPRGHGDPEVTTAACHSAGSTFGCKTAVRAPAEL